MTGTTVSFMRCCKKTLERLLVAGFLVLCATAAQAAGISVSKAELRAVDDGYAIVADFKINLPPSVSEALQRGVTLNFISNLAIMRSRWYWLDTDVMDSEQVTKLSYNALTRQYRLSRGTLFQGFSNLENALRVLGHQSSPSVPAAALIVGDSYVSRWLKSQARNTAFVQMRLDTSQLPKPLQVNALTDSDWNMESEKYSWTVDVAPRPAGGGEAQ